MLQELMRQEEDLSRSCCSLALYPFTLISGLNDSKRLESKKENISGRIKNKALLGGRSS